MAQIVRLAEYRKAASSRRGGTSAHGARHDTPHALQSGAPHYFCLRCDTDQFKLYPAGTVHCAHCGALMRNISVSDKGSS
jgi:hypothetical protein